MKILLLEDEVMLNSAISEYLSELGFEVHQFFDGKLALENSLKEKFDLFIMDINVPITDGFSVLEKLHENKIQTPTIFISAMTDIEDITRGFKLGCFDYIKKPFHLKELNLRIERILAIKHTPLNHTIISKNYSYSMEKKHLFFQNKIETLSKRQLDIIDFLAKNIGYIVTFDQFRDSVWENDLIDNATIRAEINRLKKILKEDFIKNIRGLGYQIEQVNNI
jgi:DNA-binding response OmpR family regulator